MIDIKMGVTLLLGVETRSESGFCVAGETDTPLRVITLLRGAEKTDTEDQEGGIILFGAGVFWAK